MIDKPQKKKEILDKKKNDRPSNQHIIFKNNKILVSCSISIFTFNQAYDSIWEIISDAIKVNSILAKIFPIFRAEPIQITKVPPGHILNKFLLIINGRIKIYFNMVEQIETDYFSMIIWEISQQEELLNPKNDPIKYEDPNRKAKIRITIQKTSYKQTFFTFSCSNFIIDKRACAQRKTEDMKMNLYLTYLDKSLSKFYSKIQTQREDKLIHSGLNFCLQFFMKVKACAVLVGNLISLTDEIIKKGTIVKYKNKKNMDCLLQVRKFLLEENRFITNLWIYEGGMVLSGQPSREVKAEFYNVNKDETFVILTHYFVKRVTKDDIEFMKNLKKNLLNKLGHFIEKAWKQEKKDSI